MDIQRDSSDTKRKRKRVKKSSRDGRKKKKSKAKTPLKSQCAKRPSAPRHSGHTRRATESAVVPGEGRSSARSSPSSTGPGLSVPFPRGGRSSPTCGGFPRGGRSRPTSRHASKGYPRTKRKRSPARATGELSDLQHKLKKRLQGGRFRWINEQLYTMPGEKAAQMFKEQPEMFTQYHTGFRKQVSQWPENPLDIFISQLQAAPKNSLVVADMGCGEARLAQSVDQKVHSFDLHAGNEYITACDISKVPLPSSEVDVVVFCLALMGTNFMDFIREAHRILKLGGVMKIAEVKSRFEGKSPMFVQAIEATGFTNTFMNEDNKMFSLFEFKKTSEKCTRATFTLKACVYKKR